ncbi:methyltransferase family protein [Chitinophaga niastensis]|uniref:Methyltransferase family protein n=1 Tax=Chitinophaga niastensis TaxID=536980 RepID=A0A2P8HQ08_CHINA|nr:class I SAM-dependent methyltransferase [Chitinophaga niastensis]PSL48323.1 methyltransferase family protein [Chitinophaga niastensis]
MKNEATERAKMPKGTSAVLDSRSLQNSYATLIPILKKGMRVLDVGCGTGAISAGIANVVGEEGYVVGIDSSDHLIAKGKADYAAISNLELIETDLFKYNPAEKFDLIVSARVLQWLSNPEEALLKFKDLLKPDGEISILDYNHTALEWKPAPPASMARFYKAFLNWRADAGMDNEIADHLAASFHQLGFHSITSLNANEVYKRGEESFIDKAGIWSKVAESRGLQMVEGGYITDEERMNAIADYNAWIADDAEWMMMKLNDIRAKI